MEESTRIRQTKERIHAALLQMLQSSSLRKIAIKELCRIAKVNRTTFYNHYGSQYDVFDEMAKQYIQSTSFTVAQGIASGKDIGQCLVEVLGYMKEHQAFARMLLEAEHVDLLEQVSGLLPQFDELVMRNLPCELSEEKKKAIASYVEYGSVRLLKEWLQGGCSRAPKEEAELLIQLAGCTIGGYSQKKENKEKKRV